MQLLYNRDWKDNNSRMDRRIILKEHLSMFSTIYEYYQSFKYVCFKLQSLLASQKIKQNALWILSCSLLTIFCSLLPCLQQGIGKAQKDVLPQGAAPCFYRRSQPDVSWAGAQGQASDRLQHLHQEGEVLWDETVRAAAMERSVETGEVWAQSFATAWPQMWKVTQCCEGVWNTVIHP